jgi:hypothetical protein
MSKKSHKSGTTTDDIVRQVISKPPASGSGSAKKAPLPTPKSAPPPKAAPKAAPKGVLKAGSAPAPQARDQKESKKTTKELDKLAEDLEDEEELEEPFATMYEILDAISEKNSINAEGYHARFDEILWDPTAYREVDDAYIPKGLKAKYASLKPYLRDARTVEFPVIFNTESPAFGATIALVLANRIWDMPFGTQAEKDAKATAIQAFTDKVLYMAAEDQTDTSDTCDILYNLRKSPNEKVEFDLEEVSEGSLSESEEDEDDLPVRGKGGKNAKGGKKSRDESSDLSGSEQSDN